MKGKKVGAGEDKWREKGRRREVCVNNGDKGGGKE